MVIDYVESLNIYEGRYKGKETGRSVGSGLSDVQYRSKRMESLLVKT